jgi:hypothetical protein
MVDLCNRTGVHAWFSMPHRATDDFITQFATLVRDTLDPELKVYIEYSNEIWNLGFPQAQWAQQQGLALGLSADPNLARYRFYAQRSVEIFAIWETVFGSTDRLVRVLGGQHVNQWANQNILDWQNASQHADALATAPYFGDELGSSANAPQTVTMTVDQVLDACEADIAGDVRPNTQANKQAAESRGLELIAYEGGQHMVGSGSWGTDPTLNQLFDDANRAARMRQVYLSFHQGWHEDGGGFFCVFSHIDPPNQYGRWGILESMIDDPATVSKYMGVCDYRDWLDGHAADRNVDGQVDVADLLDVLAAWGPCPLSCPPVCDPTSDCTVDVSDLLLILARWGWIG